MAEKKKLTTKEKDDLAKKGVAAGTTLTGMGLTAAGLGVGLRKFVKHSDRLAEKSGNRWVKHLARNVAPHKDVYMKHGKTGVLYGLPVAVAGTGLASYSAYQHHKNKKKLKEEEEEKKNADNQTKD